MALCFRRFFPQVDYSYDSALDQLNNHTLVKRRHHADALFSYSSLSRFYPLLFFFVNCGPSGSCSTYQRLSHV
jgi:hypothetical protein